MIDLTKLDQSYNQGSHGNCVLSAYSIAANYFTQLPIIQFFRDYCDHFGIDVPDGDYFRAAGVQANHPYVRHPNMTGSNAMLHIHRTSEKPSFVKARAAFEGGYRQDFEDDVNSLDIFLITNEALLTVGWRFPDGGNHVVNYFIANDTCFVRDTCESMARPCDSYDVPRGGRMTDGVLYTASKVGR